MIIIYKIQPDLDLAMLKASNQLRTDAKPERNGYEKHIFGVDLCTPHPVILTIHVISNERNK